MVSECNNHFEIDICQNQKKLPIYTFAISDLLINGHAISRKYQIKTINYKQIPISPDYRPVFWHEQWKSKEVNTTEDENLINTGARVARTVTSYIPMPASERIPVGGGSLQVHQGKSKASRCGTTWS
jgi:hypothetical protein